MEHSESNNKARKWYSLSFRSVAIIFALNSIVTLMMVFTRGVHLSAPLVARSPCDLSDDFLSSIEFSTDHVILHNPDVINNNSCVYMRNSLALGAKTVNDIVTVRVYRITYDMPKKFRQFANGYTDDLDRRISNGHEIRVLCDNQTECSVYIDPNVIMEFNYLSGESPRHDAMLWARKFMREDQDIL